MDNFVCIDTGCIPELPAKVDARIVDGDMLIHSLPTSHVRTFQGYTESVFLPSIDRQLTTSARLEIVWDSYAAGSLKDSTIT